MAQPRMLSSTGRSKIDIVFARLRTPPPGPPPGRAHRHPTSTTRPACREAAALRTPLAPSTPPPEPGGAGGRVGAGVKP
eukprot:3284563-Prymnesium_polylepis.1